MNLISLNKLYRLCSFKEGLPNKKAFLHPNSVEREDQALIHNIITYLFAAPEILSP